MNSQEIILDDQFKKRIEYSLNSQTCISFITFVLGDIGEAKLKYVLSAILEKYNKIELMELLYTSAKELIINSTKAAIKRLFFLERGIEPENSDLYEKTMNEFKENLTHKKFSYYRQKMKQNNLFIRIRIIHNDNRIILKIINNFTLLKIEEERIREKFLKAKKYDNLYEFYLEQGDHTEGAGMGITMVEILLAQLGFDRHLFTIYSDFKRLNTIAKVEIPIHLDYIPKRIRLDAELKNKLKEKKEEILIKQRRLWQNNQTNQIL